MNLLRPAIRGLGELMVTSGLLVLLFIAWQLWWTDVVADRSQDRTTSALVQQWDAAAAADATDTGTPTDQEGGEQTGQAGDTESVVTESGATLAELPSQALALIRVPAFGADYVRPVLAGTTSDVLKEGVGHYDGTALPGEVGNFATAGHRTTYGAPYNLIEDLVEGDAIVVETATDYHVYRVARTDIVLPSQVEVIEPVPGEPGLVPTEEWMTMTSCHPMFSARQRYIVHAELESTTARVDGPPEALRAAGATS